VLAAMTRRLPVSPSPDPLEGYAARFDGLFRARAGPGEGVVLQGGKQVANRLER
jgi:hypothetical protein